MGNRNVVEISNLTKDIKGTKVLNKVNLQLESGKAYGIVGRNGSGKSMLFKAICGLINTTEGSITVFDKVIKNGSFPDDVGMIIENPGFLLQYSAFKNLKILASINNKISDERIKETIALVGLDPEDKKIVKKFSLGMKQRLGIAQALMENPKLLILDEPMNGLDSEGVKQIREILLKLKSNSVTILLASHNSDDIDEICDCVYTMENGVLSARI
ncbi:ATP-binding cassette domain-containing protein [Clostridium perfringens]|uniref:Antibiotic ABC transporter ATP-binding protein n=2 Tax=Clostridium perfringens TaxID=1502 RepID=A0A2X3C6L2_CLOPF|nr:ATP-binding cassette domain-containing protein [Clostridium perfringens]ABG86941.1 antibiotic ABC transporter, ATP-binding protein [Clostridium perfringens SM101]EJT5939585.1 ATP-binding cassette domain-containing protein [Clostridium perfringens]EJT6471675.1 ATP-binding cassette domain-containing protein [Clostridium perfringens]MBP2860129.1 ATP-binding cassette domain-containing protein [Clostridium perfringens]MDG6876747.1 Methionine import ATP-binding protein MetN [Clostridium perfringe